MKNKQSIFLLIAVVVLTAVALMGYGPNFQASVMNSGADAVCTQRTQELGCATFTCTNNTCECVTTAVNTQDETNPLLKTFPGEPAEKPTNARLALLEKKILFNDRHYESKCCLTR